MRTDYCVYTHLRPDDSIFYVGKGIPSRPYRSSVRNSQWQSEVGLHGSYTVNIVKSHLTEEEAFAVEVRLIKMLRERGVSIVNMTRGGDGCKELIFTDEVKQKLKLKRSQQTPPTLGKKWDDSLKQLWRSQRIGANNPMYGKKHTEETKAKFKNRVANKPWLGKKLSDEQKAHLSMTRICPHCQKVGKGNIMLRHHMDNCKAKE